MVSMIIVTKKDQDTNWRTVDSVSDFDEFSGRHMSRTQHEHPVITLYEPKGSFDEFRIG